MTFIIARQTGWHREYWRGAELDNWSTDKEVAHQFDTFDEAYETMKETVDAFTEMLVEKFYPHFETQCGPLPSEYHSSLTAILVTVPAVKGVVEQQTLFDLEIIKLKGETI